MSTQFLVSPSNELAYQAVEALLRGEPEFRRVLLVGARGSGKSSLAAWAKTVAPAISTADPVVKGDLPSLLKSDAPLLATYGAENADTEEVIRVFRAAGGRTFSLVIESELTEALARNMAEDLGFHVADDALRMIVDRLKSPVLVRGALHRLRAEAALQGKNDADGLFAIRALGSFLYPAR